MDLNLISVFLAVYRQRSITRASIEIGLTQPAVSAALKRLRSKVHRDLFVRKGRGVEPTAAAVMLAEQFAMALELVESATARLEKLKIYCTESLLAQVTALDQYVQESPNDEYLVLEHLRAQQVDLVIDVIDTQDPSYIVEPLFDEEIVMICRRDHPRIGPGCTLEQVKAEKQVGLTVRRFNLTVLELLTKQPLSWRNVTAEVASTSSTLTLVASTDYLGGVGRSLAEQWADALQLQVLPLPFDTVPVRYKMLYLRRFAQDAQHAAVREKIKALFIR